MKFIIKIWLRLKTIIYWPDSLMYERKAENVYEDFSQDKRMFYFINYSTKSKIYNDFNKLAVGKMKDETVCVATDKFAGLKTKMYSFLVDDSSKHKEAKGMNKSIVATISHNEWKDVLLNQKCLRHSIIRIPTKNQRIETYEIYKNFWSCFDNKIYILNNRYYGLAHGYQI